MTLEVLQTVKSSFDRIASKASLGVAGLTIGLIAIVMGGATLTGISVALSPVLGAVVGMLTAAAYIGGLVSLSVGSLRAFDQKTVTKEMFTENIIWPFLRITGSNIVLQAFALTVAYLVLYPAILLIFGATGMMQGTMTGAPQLGDAAIAGLGVSGGITAILVLYVFAALSIALPRIAISDKRIFQALDESIQATKGSRLQIAATILPFAALLVAGAGALLVLGGILGTLLYMALAVIGSLYWLALLAELNERL